MSAPLVPAAVDAIVAERAGVLAFARSFRAQLEALVAAKRLGAEEATTLGNRVCAFADGIAQGLHVSGDPVEVSRAVKAMLREADRG